MDTLLRLWKNAYLGSRTSAQQVVPSSLLQKCSHDALDEISRAQRETYSFDSSCELSKRLVIGRENEYAGMIDKAGVKVRTLP